MTDINKNSRINKRSLFNDLDDKKKKIIKNVKSSSLNNLNIITRKAFNLERTSKENLTLIEFIKQKNKFFIESSFDVNGTREFLASKEVAMRAIKLNDEIIEEKKENEVKMSCFTNKNLMKIDIDNYNNDVIKKKSTKNANKRTISPRKSRKNEKIKMKLDEDFSPKKNTIKPKKKSNKKVKFKKSESKVNGGNLNSSNNDNENNIIFDKPDNESLSNIYKFFIDNANESEENFNKKLKKELKKVENMKQNKEKSKEKAVKVKRKSLSKKDLRKRPKRMNSVSVPKKETQSAFIFSEINKNLMKDDIDVSSIGENDTKQNTNEKKKMVRRAYGSIQINNRQVKENIYKQMEKESKDKDNNNDNLIVGKEDINSDKDSIIINISDLM
jgi:hypothetical protein